MEFSNIDTIETKIINKILKNRISTTEVADCLGKKGVVAEVLPINKGHFKAGRVFLVYGYNERNWEIHDQVRNVPEGSIVVVETINCGSRAVFGELVAKYLLLYKGAVAVVANGYMRDANRLYRENYPIWCKGVTPIGCINKKNDEDLEKVVLLKWKEMYEGSIAVCDDGGVVIVPRSEINEEFLEKLDFIELQEDIWNYCINQIKMSTYETVCLQAYKETGLLPKELKVKFEEFVRRIDRK